MAIQASWLATQPPLSGCWYLSDHWNPDAQEPTNIGDLVDHATSTPGNPGSSTVAHKVASLMGQSAAALAMARPYPLTGVKLTVPVPAFPADDPHSLPDILAMYVAGGVGATYDPKLVTKVLETPKAEMHTPDEIHRFVSKAYRVTRPLHGERILLVDDVVRSAETLRTIAELLIDAGAGEVSAFVAVKDEPKAGEYRRPA
jgi:phosphoribosylpyrophosphate synthetase